MNIWFVSIFENTPIDDNKNTRYNSLVREANKRGHRVTFWASTFKHNVKKQRYDRTTKVEIDKGLSLHFVKTLPYQKNISFKRLLSHRKFGKQIVKEFDWAVIKPDLIMMAFPPVSSANTISEWAKANGIPCIVDIIDPWPDVFKAHLSKIPDGLLDILTKPIKINVSKTMSRVTAITGISNQYIDWAKEYGAENINMKCFYPAVQFDEMQLELQKASENTSKNSDCFNIIYAGSLGHSYDIPTILKAAEILEKNYENICFTIAGDGPQKNKVQEYQKNHTNLEYIGRVPKEKLMEYYYIADMGMTQHIKGATQSVTYKLFDLLACGLPILNSLESEMQDIIVENDVGLHNEPGDAEQLAENIIFCTKNRDKLDIMKENAISLTKKLGDSKKVYSEAIDFLESLKGIKS